MRSIKIAELLSRQERLSIWLAVMYSFKLSKISAAVIWKLAS
jgi:hypothetical protein